MASGYSSRYHGITGSRVIKKSKKRKVSEEETLDRLTELPDSLIVQILSLMPTKYAVRTCILSKRWRYLSTCMHTFIFTPNDSFDQKDEKLVSFVDNVFAHSLSSKINKFQLMSCCLDEYEAKIAPWLSFAVDRKVEHVEFSTDSGEVYSLPPEPLCTCSTLITLVLFHCYFDVDVVVAWKSLKSIKLEWVVLSNDSIAKLLSGCPALETMKLDLVHGFSRLEIKSSKLKRLEINNWEDTYNDPCLEIIASYLQHLEISGPLYNLQCRLVDVSSLVIAKLTFSIDCIQDIQASGFYEHDDDQDSCDDYHKVFRTLVQNNLQKLSCATELTIGSWFTMVLCMLPLEGVQIPELKCRYLSLEFDIKRSSVYGVAGLLQASPYVETLNINMEIACVNSYGFSSLCDSELGHSAKGENIDLDCWISSFDFPNLKNVKIFISYKLCLKDHLEWNLDKLFKLSEILLKSAKVLEKFVIISKEKCTSCSKNCGSRYIFQLAEKFIGCPRSSTNSVIIILQE